MIAIRILSPQDSDLAREQREAALVSGYASIGITCYVVWEDTLEADLDAIRSILLEPQVFAEA